MSDINDDFDADELMELADIERKGRREDQPGQSVPLIDDPAWVLARYREAKELLDEVWADPAVPFDLRRQAEDFHNATLMDSCTTLGPDCACNGGRS